MAPTLRPRLGGLEGCALGLHGSDNILKVAYAAGEAVDPRDHERFALSERPTPLADVELAAQLVAFGLVVLHQLGRGD